MASIYTIILISNQQLRDIKLEHLLDPDFIMEKYIHEGIFDYSVRIKNGYRIEMISNKSHNDRSILNSSRWKTLSGADTGIIKVINIMKEKRAVSVRSLNSGDFWKNEYIPVICDITEEWNKKINLKIQEEEREHNKKIISLNKKLVSLSA